jgi:hypothetical protein
MKRFALMISLVAIVSASACASGPAAYAPAVGEGAGYSEEAVGEGRYRIAFRGNSRTSDAAVKQMLFYRAAEFTLARGRDVFEVIGAAGHASGGQNVSGDASFEPVMSRSHGHNIYGLITSEEWAVSSPVTSARQYTADVEIIMRSGPLPASPRFFDAREVISLLKPVIPGL